MIKQSCTHTYTHRNTQVTKSVYICWSAVFIETNNCCWCCYAIHKTLSNTRLWTAPCSKSNQLYMYVIMMPSENIQVHIWKEDSRIKAKKAKTSKPVRWQITRKIQIFLSNNKLMSNALCHLHSYWQLQTC